MVTVLRVYTLYLTPSDQIIIHDVHQLLTPLVTVVPTQLISYYAAL